MDAKTKRMKEEVLKKLRQLKITREKADDLILEIEGKLEEINGEKKPVLFGKERPVKLGYGTSCVQLRKDGKKLIEY